MHPDNIESKDDACSCHCRDPACVPALQAGQRSFVLFVEGDALYEAMLADIAMARTYIHMESYIFAADEVGWRFARVLGECVMSGSASCFTDKDHHVSGARVAAGAFDRPAPGADQCCPHRNNRHSLPYTGATSGR